MNSNYYDNAKKFKALSDVNRLKIFEILLNEEKCACDILEYFDFTQSTLSHHMKILTDCELIKCRKEGHWSWYSIDSGILNDFKLSIICLNIEKEV